jgi:hypothetical protein
VLRRIFGPKRDEVTGIGENLIMRSFIVCNAHPLLCGSKIEKNEMGETCSAYDGGERRAQGFGGKT